MGSDNSPKVLFEGVLQAADQLDPSNVLLVIATHSVVSDLQLYFQQLPVNPNRAHIEFHPVSDSIAMADEPVLAISRKKGSSLVVGIRLLKKKLIDAFVTAGNTGALIASATLQLPLLPGIKRPALLVSLPTVTGSVAILDVGGNVQCKAQHLVQFAHMGAAYQSCSEGIEAPKVGLLNIGVEAKKGTSSVREAYQTLTNYCEKTASQKMRFVGNVEGRELFQGTIDVLITDGFTGNVLLKTSEGVSSFIFSYIQETLQNSDPTPLHESLSNLRKYFSYAEYPGAFVCGVDGIVVKCHGHSSSRAMFSGINGAATLVRTRVIDRIKSMLSDSE